MFVEKLSACCFCSCYVLMLFFVDWPKRFMAAMHACAQAQLLTGYSAVTPCPSADSPKCTANVLPTWPYKSR